MGRKRAAIGIIWGLSILLATPGLMLAQAPEPKEPANSSLPKSKPTEETSARAVGRLVDALERHPVPPRDAPDRVGLYLLDLVDGDVTLIADQPAPGLTQCGSSTWSHDGRRILHDATPGTQWSLTRLKMIEVGDGRPTVTDLGTGNCPAFAPADHRIAFLSNADGAPTGVWLMKADGSDRRLLGAYGVPKWSPDGRRMMIVSFGNPRQVTLMDADPQKSGALNIPDGQIFSVPSWADAGSIVAAIVSDEGDALALVDVRDPSHCRVKEVLWKKAGDLDIRQSYPIYWPDGRRCIFVGGGPRGMALYSVQPGQAGPPKRLGLEGYAPKISGLAFSPDGRYVLYSEQGPDRTHGGRAPGTRVARGEDRPATRSVKHAWPGRIYLTTRPSPAPNAPPGPPLVAIDPGDGESRTIVSGCADRARVSPDGRNVAFARGGGLWVRKLSGDAEPRQVADLDEPSGGSPAVWSPDGKELVISVGHHDDRRRGWIHKTSRVRIDGSKREALPIPPEDNVQDWSSDGRRLLTASSREARIGWQLYVMRPDGTESRRITEGGNPFYARFSPDGRRVIYTDNARGGQGIWVVDADGKNARLLLPVDRESTASACWSPDGKGMAVVISPLNPASPGDKGYRPVRIVVVDLDGRRQSESFLDNAGNPDMPDWR
jgi:Tol biopolymer transport system component